MRHPFSSWRTTMWPSATGWPSCRLKKETVARPQRASGPTWLSWTSRWAADARQLITELFDFNSDWRDTDKSEPQNAIAWRKSGHSVKLGFIPLILAVVIAPSWTQEPPPSRSQSMSKSLGLHTFPAKDQTVAQQQKDEMTCYDWARQDSGYDPIAAATAQAQTTPAQPTVPPTPSTKGAGAKGAAGGQ